VLDPLEVDQIARVLAADRLKLRPRSGMATMLP
jgi:hypothetical protein